MYRSGTDHAIRPLDIFLPVANGYLNPLTDQFICRHRRIHIRTGNIQSHSLQNQAKGAH